MKLADHFSRSGHVLFRWRGYLPLLLCPLFLVALLEARLPHPVSAAVRAWQAFSVLLALAGLAIRVIAVGTAASGTSERSTTAPRASKLRTTGIYSLVRHPLYVGNTITAVGLASFTTGWYLPVIVLLLGLLYHERIAAHEEAFLEERFTDEFRSWASAVPAMVPAWGGYIPSDEPFRWRRPLSREIHGLMAIASVVFVLDLFRAWLASGKLDPDPVWTPFFLASAAIFVVLRALKKRTAVFREEEEAEARPSAKMQNVEGGT